MLRERKDDKVQADDHKKCERAFRAAMLKVFTADHADGVYDYESNLILLAKYGDTEGIEATLKEDVEMEEGAAKRITDQLVIQFDSLVW